MFDVDAPDWAEHPVYSSMLSDGERLREQLDRGPAGRTMADFAAMDAGSLAAG